LRLSHESLRFIRRWLDRRRNEELSHHCSLGAAARMAEASDPVGRDERPQLSQGTRNSSTNEVGSSESHVIDVAHSPPAPNCREQKTARRSINACRPSGSARCESAPKATAREEIRSLAKREETVLVAEATVQGRADWRRGGDARATRILRRRLWEDPILGFYAR